MSYNPEMGPEAGIEHPNVSERIGELLHGADKRDITLK